jgi:hypothetical protein
MLVAGLMPKMDERNWSKQNHACQCNQLFHHIEQAEPDGKNLTVVRISTLMAKMSRVSVVMEVLIYF